MQPAYAASCDTRGSLLRSTRTTQLCERPAFRATSCFRSLALSRRSLKVNPSHERHFLFSFTFDD